MNKTEILNTIDNLIVSVSEPTAVAVDDLIDSQLRWKDISDLQDFWRMTMYEFYMSHANDFKEDFYWEFCVVD